MFCVDVDVIDFLYIYVFSFILNFNKLISKLVFTREYENLTSLMGKRKENQRKLFGIRTLQHQLQELYIIYNINKSWSWKKIFNLPQVLSCQICCLLTNPQHHSFYLIHSLSHTHTLSLSHSRLFISLTSSSPMGFSHTH